MGGTADKHSHEVQAPRCISHAAPSSGTPFQLPPILPAGTVAQKPAHMCSILPAVLDCLVDAGHVLVEVLAHLGGGHSNAKVQYRQNVALCVDDLPGAVLTDSYL